MSKLSPVIETMEHRWMRAWVAGDDRTLRALTARNFRMVMGSKPIAVLDFHAVVIFDHELNPAPDVTAIRRIAHDAADDPAVHRDREGAALDAADDGAQRRGAAGHAGDLELDLRRARRHQHRRDRCDVGVRGRELDAGAHSHRAAQIEGDRNLAAGLDNRRRGPEPTRSS